MDTKKHRILAVDDDQGILSIIKLKLEKKGFSVTTSQDSSQAIELLSCEPFDLIICDIVMPGTDGYELRQHILNDPSSRDIPFIFLSGKSESVDQVKGHHLGVDDYITKPFNPAILVARVKSLIERHSAYTEKTTTDQLTGILNRKALEQNIQKELDRIKRYGGHSAIVFIDIDNFKQVNDTHGHAQGDLVLIELARLFTEKLRASDYVGRYGGEEFLLCLVNTDKEFASIVVERLLASFRETPVGDKEILCTFSAGIAFAPEDGTDFELLCKRADEAMYTSKQNGRNQVTLWKDKQKQ